MRLEAREPPCLPRGHLRAEVDELDLACRLDGVVEPHVLELGLLRLEDLLRARRAEPLLPRLAPQARVHAALAADDALRSARAHLGGALLREERVEARVRRGARHRTEHGLVALVLVQQVAVVLEALHRRSRVALCRGSRTQVGVVHGARLTHLVEQVERLGGTQLVFEQHVAAGITKLARALRARVAVEARSARLLCLRRRARGSPREPSRGLLRRLARLAVQRRGAMALELDGARGTHLGVVG